MEEARSLGRAALTGARILLVEDNELNQEVATALLREVGCAVEVAPDGEVAVSQVQKCLYDLVLMDMQMPVMDGVTATQVIRQMPHLRGIPIIAMTANVMREDRERCLAAGMNDFVGKPIEPAQLWQTLRKWYRPDPNRPPADAREAAARATDGAPQSSWPDAIEGLDLVQGRARVLGNETLYRSLLRRFVESHADSPQRLERALAEGQFELAERLAHTAKSVAANIGARALANDAESLERALRERAPETVWRPLWQTYTDTLVALLAGLVPAVMLAQPAVPVPRIAEPPGTTIDAAQQAEAFARLQYLLRESDPEAGNWFDANASLLRHALEPGDFAGIKAALDAFDLDAALDLLIRAAPDGVALDTAG
jgi:CheY-like chemotaxis protein